MGFFDGPDPQNIDNWVCILERGTEYEVILAKNYLSNRNIPSNILSKRDSSYNLNIGETSMVYLYVPSQYEDVARRAFQELEEYDPDEPDSPDDLHRFDDADELSRPEDADSIANPDEEPGE